MICKVCTEAGALNKAGFTGQAYREHRKCEGCECQHKIGEGYVRNPYTKA